MGTKTRATPVSRAMPATPVADGVGLEGDFGLSLLVLTRAYRAVVASVLDEVPQGARGYQTVAVVVRGDQPNQLALATYTRVLTLPARVAGGCGGAV